MRYFSIRRFGFFRIVEFFGFIFVFFFRFRFNCAVNRGSSHNKKEHLIIADKTTLLFQVIVELLSGNFFAFIFLNPVFHIFIHAYFYIVHLQTFASKKSDLQFYAAINRRISNPRKNGAPVCEFIVQTADVRVNDRFDKDDGIFKPNLKLIRAR
ncbi:MAG: hypothetical protein LBG72_04120 [Spirochaetaceae bacterium]|nr:hypothetical protein [Spirochaetaceae bacterium]